MIRVNNDSVLLVILDMGMIKFNMANFLIRLGDNAIMMMSPR